MHRRQTERCACLPAAVVLPLSQLRILNLGSQFGHNDGSDAVGLMGTVPRQLSELQHLRELNLESNALTGELPETLCKGGETSVAVYDTAAAAAKAAAAVETAPELLAEAVAHAACRRHTIT
jgi:hypothetical protein